MAEKHITGREALSQEDRDRLDALKKLHECAHDPVDKMKLRVIEKAERQAGMTVMEKIQDESREDYAYKGSGLQQIFSTIKQIVAHKGMILIVVDEAESEKKARLQAFQALGPLAPPEQIAKYIVDHADHTTLLTIPKFMKNLRNFVGLVASHPEMFGTGGSAAREVMDDALGAVKEAREYLRQHRNELPEDWYNFLRGGDIQTTDKRKFVEYLGNDWEVEMNMGGVRLDDHTILVKAQKH